MSPDKVAHSPSPIANETVLTILQFFPYVLTAVKSVEDTTAEAKLDGKSKKHLILDAVLAAAKVGESAPDSLVNVIAGLIHTVVTSLNAKGIFKKSTPAAATPKAA